MRLWLLVICLAFSAKGIRIRRSVSTAIQTTKTSITNDAILQIQKERKERRLLRKKKQRLKELRSEIKILTQQLHREKVHGSKKKEILWKELELTKEDRWRRKLLEKMKGILRRLDRIEKGKPPRKIPANLLMGMTTVAPLLTTTSVLKTSIVPPNDNKMKRIKSSMDHSRNGGNGTLCVTHKDCRPGHCCQYTSEGGSLHAQCSFFSYTESSSCIDSCQCSHQLHCFQPSDNSTKPICKKADSKDIEMGVYLYNKDAVFAEKRKKKK